MQSAVGRNEPCPCGSGKKYKKCCLPRDQELQRAAQASTSTSSAPLAAPAGESPVILEGDDLDELSNSIVDLIQAGELDEAERRCGELRDRYPEVVDWMMRLAAVHEARGNCKEAASHYRQAADFAEQDGGYDPELIDDFRQQAERLQRRSST